MRKHTLRPYGDCFVFGIFHTQARSWRVRALAPYEYSRRQAYRVMCCYRFSLVGRPQRQRVTVARNP